MNQQSGAGRFDPRRLLHYPAIYNLHANVFAHTKQRQSFVDYILKVEDGNRVLDIGCGTALLLGYMPKVEYVGFDLSEQYVHSAKQRYSEGATFLAKPLTSDAARDMPPFDLAMAIGVVHHLDDKEAETLFRVAHGALRSGGRLVTCDGVWVEGQSILAKIFLSMDRGKFIRYRESYVEIASRVFTNVLSSVHHDLNTFPYSHCVLTCLK
jgi:cyclopropane fatty-acyl-phospholipid synthase-like methyltransferase